MKPLFVTGIVLLVLGIALLIVPIPHTQRSGVKFGGAEVGVETHSEDKAPPFVSAALIIAGAGMMIAARTIK